MGSARLYALQFEAEKTGGFITSKKAQSLGIPPTTLVKMADRGSLERSSRGLYRVPFLPIDAKTQYWEAILSVDGGLSGRSAISHVSALTLRGLSDASPTKIHVTIHKSERIRRILPAFIKIHRSDLDPLDVERYLGIPVTVFAKTVSDCLDSFVDRSILAQSIDQAFDQGLVTEAEARTLRARVSM